MNYFALLLFALTTREGPTPSWKSAMGSTSRNWLIYWRQPAVGAPRRQTEVAIL